MMKIICRNWRSTMLYSRAAIFSVFIILINASENSGPSVETSLGKIRGQHKKSYGGRIFSAFEGIPYAKPPIGDLRFQAPSDVEPWSGILDAITIHTCIQTHMLIPTSVIGDEDCLYLNVYVPREKPISSDDLDVIVHIHGGAFIMGSPTVAGPEFLMDRNIVYVNLSYRLSILGFLYTEDSTVSANNGLKDQVHALKWVQKHIAKFGGNPKCVTIIGTSAGGASVHLHYFSPSSNGLFHRGISQSGTALAPWVIQDAPLDVAMAFGKLAGCTTTSNEELVKCLKQKTAEELTVISQRLLAYTVMVVMQNVTDEIVNASSFPSYAKLLIIFFGPVIEQNVKDAFLSDHPYNLLVEGKINDAPWMSSVVTDEGLLGLTQLNMLPGIFGQNWSTLYPYYLSYIRSVDEKLLDEVSQKIGDFYYGNENGSTSTNIQPLIQMYGDRFFVLSMEESTRLQANLEKSKVYGFQYGYKADHNNVSLFGFNNSFGVNHGADGSLLYNGSYDGFYKIQNKLSDSDEKIKEIQLDIVTSFAKAGQPHVKGIYNWAPIDGKSPDFRYLYIGNDGVKVKVTRELAPTAFWKSLPIVEHKKREL